MNYKDRKKLNMKLKSRFFFGNNFFYKSAKLYIRRTTSNFIVTLTDLRDRVIVCCTSGSSIKIQCNKKRRISPYAMEDIVQALSETLNRLNIKSLHIVLKIRTGMVVRFLFNEIFAHGFKIFCVEERLSCPHNGIRSRALPRK
jgi:ribosomal protein S11